LPKLAEGPFAGCLQVFGLAWAFVAHTDSHLDMLRRFIVAYQRVQPLTIGELWAVAITLRIVLIENLRRLTEQIDDDRVARADADGLANRLLAPDCARSALVADEGDWCGCVLWRSALHRSRFADGRWAGPALSQGPDRDWRVPEHPAGSRARAGGLPDQ
jgi:hypothetical protein